MQLFQETLVWKMLVHSMIGKIIGRLKITTKIGAGGMGTAWLAEHFAIGIKFAVKCLAPELTRYPEFQKRFYHEAKSQAELGHLNIVQITDYFKEHV